MKFRAGGNESVHISVVPRFLDNGGIFQSFLCAFGWVGCLLSGVAGCP